MDKTVEVNLYELHPNQEKILAEAKRFNVLACGRRFGKTLLGMDLVSNALLDGKPVAWFSPTYKMLEDVWRTQLEQVFPIIKNKSEQQHRIETYTGGVLDMWSLDAADSARGRAYKLIVVDEAAKDAELTNHWNYIMRPMLIDLVGDAWFFSTPQGRNGFYKLYLLGQDDQNPEWKSEHFTTYDNPTIPREEIDKLKDTMTEEAWRQEIMAEFLEGEGAVFRNLKACLTAAKNATPQEHEGHLIVAGIDWGKQNDFTAISIGCATCRRELALDRFNQIDYLFQVQRLKAAFEKWSVHLGKVELNSIGQPLFEQLQREKMPVVAFETTMSSKPPLIEGLALELEKSTVSLLDEPAATAELEAYERTVNPKTGHSSYSAPEEMHDDTVMARALMVQAMNNYFHYQRKLQPNPWERVVFTR